MTPEEKRETLTWQGQWQEAVRDSAGSEPYLEDGADYVEDLRLADTERSRASRVESHDTS
jgi:hypothetical protein